MAKLTANQIRQTRIRLAIRDQVETKANVSALRYLANNDHARIATVEGSKVTWTATKEGRKIAAKLCQPCPSLISQWWETL